MPISFACSCGKQLVAKETFAGRRIKCPTCGNVLTIPGASSGPLPPAASPPASLPPASLPPERGSFSVQVAGPPPVPGVPPPVPPASIPVVSDLPEVLPVKRASPIAAGNPWRDTLLTQTITPWPEDYRERAGAVGKRSERTGGRWLVLLIAAVVLGAGIGALWYFWPQISTNLLAFAHLVEEANEPEEWSRLEDLDFVPGEAPLVVTFRPDEFWQSPARPRVMEHFFGGRKLDEELKTTLGLGPEQLARVTIFANERTPVNLSNFGGLLVLVRTKEPFDREKMRRKLAGDVPRGKKWERFAQRLVKRPDVYAVILNPTMILFGNEEDVRFFIHTKPRANDPGPLRRALDLAKKEKGLICGLNLFASERSPALLNLSDEEAEKVKGFETLMNFRALTLTAAAGGKSELVLYAEYGNFAEAQAAALVAKNVLQLRRDDIKEGRKQIEAMRIYVIERPVRLRCAFLTIGGSAAGLATPTGPLAAIAGPLDGERVAKELTAGKSDLRLEMAKVDLDRREALLGAVRIVAVESELRVSVPLDKKVLGDPVIDPLEFAKSVHDSFRARSRDKLAKIARALRNYQSIKGKFPPPEVGGGLSWRVEILPFLGYTSLYEKFKRNESWDSEHNQKLLDEMPPEFAPDGGLHVERNHTFYRVFVGPGAAFEKNQQLSLGDFKGREGNTILIAEATEPVPWTKPDELTFDPRRPLPPLAGVLSDSFLAAFVDGSVRRIPMASPPEEIRAMVQRTAAKKGGNGK